VITDPKDDTLVRAEAFFQENQHRCFMAEASVAVELLHKLLAKARGLQSQIDALQTDDEIPGWIDDLEYMSLCRETKLLDIAKKWHAAYRKVQNSNLIRKQQAEQAEATAEIAAICHRPNGSIEFLKMTPERRAALKEALEYLGSCNVAHDAQEVLRAVLDGTP